MVQLSHPYMTTGKTIVLTIQTFVGKVMSLLFNTLSRLVSFSSKEQASFNFTAAVKMITLNRILHVTNKQSRICRLNRTELIQNLKRVKSYSLEDWILQEQLKMKEIFLI